MNAKRRAEILTRYAGHLRRFDRIASGRRGPGALPDPVVTQASEADCLSDRQLEVLVLMAEGLSNPEICARLDIALETVKTHVLHILQRLGARSRAHAVSIGYE